MDQNKRVALLTAIDLGNLTRAAEQLGYTQSGLSYVIKALEAELGFPLLVRSRAGVRPTDECQRILPLLRELDRKSRQLEQEAADIRGLAVGNVFIATFPSISRFWLPQILRDFVQLYPGITVSIRESGQEEQDEWLREGAIDLAFCSYHDSPYHWIPFLEDEIWAAVPAGHSLAACDEIDLLLFFRDPMTVKAHEPNESDMFRLCDMRNIPVATNIATAEVLIHGLERGDLDWRNIVNPGNP